ncbi:hypothetical protein R1sor_018216 [Riccia sorocarpa]|uniref:WW domain-containing protein n=1 Tax=Riccia sorocarpa TaxID=122646 RepID=A0ABD3IAT1_9MARC
MVMERGAAAAAAGVSNERQLLDRDIDNGSILPSSLGKIFLELDQNPPLPAGWEKCLDIQSGSIYFKDRISGTCTYKDPRSKRQAASPSPSPTLGNIFSDAAAEPGLAAAGLKDSRNRCVTLEEKLASWSKCLSYAASEDATRLELSLKVDSGIGTGCCYARNKEEEEDDKSAKASLQSAKSEDISSCCVEEPSVCTVEKVKNALKRSHFRALTRNDSGCTNSSLSSLHTLSLNLPSPSSPSLRACRSFRSYACSNTSFSSSSHSAMSFQGDESEELREEATSSDTKALATDSVNQSVLRNEEKSGIMVTFGCQRCLMYIMLPKGNPCCPKCGGSDLLEIYATSLPKRRRV